LSAAHAPTAGSHPKPTAQAISTDELTRKGRAASGRELRRGLIGADVTLTARASPSIDRDRAADGRVDIEMCRIELTRIGAGFSGATARASDRVRRGAICRRGLQPRRPA
jgi:hypothetical protein